MKNVTHKNTHQKLERREFIKFLEFAGFFPLFPLINSCKWLNAFPRAITRDYLQPGYEFTIEEGWLKMRDNVRLAVTYYLPETDTSEEGLPILLEMHPYRKDDVCYIGDYESYTWFARRGFAVARVDLCGTGSSEGKIVASEYSSEELTDGEEIIAQLAKLPWSNGNIGMIGISWSANNALMIALRNPPALKALVIAHPADDLFHDDIHYIDGINTVSDYEILMEGENILPRSPEYPLDEEYFRTRFDAYPWFLTYMKHQRDGEFWRADSARYHYKDLHIPTYVIGGLLDGYRDSVMRILEGSQGAVRVDMGPYNHSYPDYAEPGPNYEWRYDAMRWFDHWLNSKKNGIEDEPSFNVFVRAGNPPDELMTTTPGEWRTYEWPIEHTKWTSYYPSAEGGLSLQKEKAAVDELPYQARYGVEASGSGYWWGEVSGDVSPSDEGALVYDSEPLTKKIEIIGFPKVRLRTSVDAPHANWIVRLEDVQPDGSVTLVTGAGLNGSQRDSAVKPKPLQPDTPYNLVFDLHFTTWTFQPEHKIRLAVTNAQFPMFWSTPYSMTMSLYVGDEATIINLPVIPHEDVTAPNLLEVESEYEEPPDAKYLVGESTPVEGGNYTYGALDYNAKTGVVSIENKSEGSYSVKDRLFSWVNTYYHETNQKNPQKSCYLGTNQRTIIDGERTIELSATIDMRSTLADFHILVTRKVYENEEMLREKVWDEVIPRDYQ